jgi:hypothetical protein
VKGWTAWTWTGLAICLALTVPGAHGQVQSEETGLSDKQVRGIRAELVCSCECGDEIHDLAHKNNCADYNNKLCRVASGLEKRYAGCKEIGVAK